MLASDEDDIYDIDDDEILGKTRAQKERLRKAVKLNYNSDSSDEEDDSDNNISDGKSKQENNEVDNDDEEDDMFAGSDDEKDPVPNKKSKQSSQFLDITQVEGIESMNPPSDDEDEEDDDEEEEEEVVSKKKKRSPKIEAFNLEEEANEGKFDLEGNYIRNDTNPDAKTINDDPWLDNFKKKDIKKARRAQEERKKQQTDRLLHKNINMEPIEVLLARLIDLLEPDESPMEALARLNPKKKKVKSKKKESNLTNINNELIQSITDLCSTLINDKYLDDVYELTREELMRKYQMEAGEPYQIKRGVKRELEEDGNDTRDGQEEVDYGEKIWEFRWIGEDEINGPYSNYEMSHWKETYFENRVEVRKAGEKEFHDVSSIEFT